MRAGAVAGCRVRPSLAVFRAYVSAHIKVSKEHSIKLCESEQAELEERVPQAAVFLAQLMPGDKGGGGQRRLVRPVCRDNRLQVDMGSRSIPQLSVCNRLRTSGPFEGRVRTTLSLRTLHEIGSRGCKNHYRRIVESRGQALGREAPAEKRTLICSRAIEQG